MNNEPVAWFEQDPDMKSIWYQSEQDNPKAIPLYLHPAKTLTDGMDLLEKYADKLEDERPNKGFSDVVYDCIEILRKAQEK